MPTSQGTLKPLVTISRSSEIYNTVGYPVGGNVSSTVSANFKASFASGANVIYVTYVTSGTIVPGMALSGIGIAPGTVIVGPLNQGGNGTGSLGSYTINLVTLSSQGVGGAPTGTASPPTVQYGNINTPGTTIVGQSTSLSTPQGPGGVVGPVPGFNCVNIQDLRDYYNLPYPPSTPLASPPVIAIVSFGGGIYGQPVSTGQYAGFWKCTDISGNNGAPIQILVVPINGAINAPNADDGGATLENTVDVATVNAFYGMIDPRRDAPIYTPPVIILYIAPSNDISEMYRTFYTVLKNPVVCNGKSYQPTVVSCSWGAPEIAWTQKMAFPPNPSIPVDTDPNPAGIAELNEINDLFAEATKNGINICCASGDIPLTTVNESVNAFNYAQALLLQGEGGPGDSGQVAVPQPTVFPLTDAERASLPSPQVLFPSSSPYVTCVGGSAVYFPSINTASYANAAEFAWVRGNGGISTVFSIPAYQQQLPGAAAASAQKFLESSAETSRLAGAALGTPIPVIDTISGGITAPNTGITLATQTKDDAYEATLSAFNSAKAALEAAQLSDTNDALMNSLVQAVKAASTALSTATENKRLGHLAKDAAEDLVVKTKSVSELLVNAATVFGAAAESAESVSDTQTALLAAQADLQQKSYNQLTFPSLSNSIALQNANLALQAAQAAAEASSLSAVTLPEAVLDTTDIANDAVLQSAMSVFAPSLSSHPYLAGEPRSSVLVPKSNLAYKAAHQVASDLPYDETATTAPSYLLSSLGLEYNTNYVDASGSSGGNVRGHLENSVLTADNLALELVNQARWHVTGETSSSYGGHPAGHPADTSAIAETTDNMIREVVGQLEASGSYNNAANAWKIRADRDEMLPEAGTEFTALAFATKAIALAKLGAAQISSYQSGAGNTNTDGYKLPCGSASAAASCLAAVYTVSDEVVKADRDGEFPYGSEDTSGGVDASGTYNGITTGLINLRNIYANVTLAARRATTASQQAKEAKDAFLAWTEAKEKVDLLQSQATTLYNLVPAPSNEQVRAMDKKLLEAKTELSAATYLLGLADEAVVFSARLAQQSCASTSIFMGNLIEISYDQLGNLNGVPRDDVDEYQGQNNDNCPAILEIDTSGNVAAKNALRAAQATIQAATNDFYLSKDITTVTTNGITGVDTSGNTTVSLKGMRLLVQDAQFAAATASSHVANVAFDDASESVARFTDWHNIATVANRVNSAASTITEALNDASGNSDASGTLQEAVSDMDAAISALVSTTTPYNQQATTSATIATNNVVALAAKLENLKSVCMAAQAAIQLAASTYKYTGSSNISGASNSQGGQLFTINMAYAKVTVNAAQAASTAAAILAREQAVLAARRANYSAIALRKLVGEAVIGRAVAGFVDSSGNLTSQTGYGKDASGDDHPLPYSSGYDGVNGIVPPAVAAPTVLYQGQGGLVDFSGNLLGNEATSIITNLTYTGNTADSVYEAVKNFTDTAQAVLEVLDTDVSGNSNQRSSDINNYLDYPNVNSVNALNLDIGDGDGNATNDALVAVRECLLSAYEAQQWVVASANKSFVSFGSTESNTELITFTPTPLGIVNKLASDADICLNTVLNAEGAVLYALSKRPNKVGAHDTDASNFAAVFNSNQAAFDTYEKLNKAAIAHEMNTIIAYHQADLANALSPLTATATTTANQASALGAMQFASGARNPNAGPYNGTSTGAAPYPAPNASASNRPQASAAQVLQNSSQLLKATLSDAALAAAKAGADAAQSAVAFNAVMVDVSTVTPSLVDAAQTAADYTLFAAQAANYSTSLSNEGKISNMLKGAIAGLLLKEEAAILAAAQSARANLEAITPGDARYLSRKNMLYLWNFAVDAVKRAVDAIDEAPTKYRNGSNPDCIVPASLGDVSIMGETDDAYNVGGSTAPWWNPYDDVVRYTGGTDANLIPFITYFQPLTTPHQPSDCYPSLLSMLNTTVLLATAATTGSPDTSGNYRYKAFYDASGNTVTNIPENVNDTNQAYSNALKASEANSNVGNAPQAAVVTAHLKILAAYEAAVAAATNEQPLLISGTANQTVIEGTSDDNELGSSQYDMTALRSIAVGFWNNAVQFSATLVSGEILLNQSNIAKLMAIVGINFNEVKPENASALANSYAQQANAKQAEIMAAWAQGDQYKDNSGNVQYPDNGEWPGYLDNSNDPIEFNSNLNHGLAIATYTSSNGSSNNIWSSTANNGDNDTYWSAYYWTKALMPTQTVAYKAAEDAWNSVLTVYNADNTEGGELDDNAARSNIVKADAVYTVKIALQSAFRANNSAQVSAKASTALALSSDTYEALAAESAADAAYSSAANLNMYRCVPDIAMHADADDLPVIFRFNGGNVYVGGTSVAVSMFAGFLGVVQSHSPINYFVNPVLYDNYTFPSPLFNDISGTAEVWYPGAVGGDDVPLRIANTRSGEQNPDRGLGSGIYNTDVGLGSIKGMNLATLMQVPHPVVDVYPKNAQDITVSVYPGTTATLTAYVEPPSAYNPNLVWSCSSPNAAVSQTNGPLLSNNGMNDTDPYTKYDPLQSDASGNQNTPSLSIGNYNLGSVGNIAYGTNPYNDDAPCLIFTATVTGVTSVPSSSALPVVTVSSTDGSNVYGQFNIAVLPAIQVTGVSISAENERENPSNTTLFLGTTLQLVANVTPLIATNKRVYWWSSNTSIVNVDASGLLTSLAPGQVTIKATSVNNNISSSISVYVPTPITGVSVLPTIITLNPNMSAVPLKNLGLIRAIVQPAEADYKRLKWEIVSSQQVEPAPTGISDVISLPRDGTVLSRNMYGEITDNTEATVTALSNGTVILKVSTYGDVYGIYTANVTVNVVTPITDVVMKDTDMVINLNPHTAQYDSDRSLPESYKVTATLKPAYPSNMNVFWSSSNPKVAVVSNNTPAVLNTTVSDPNFGLWQITETITPLSNGTTVIKVTTADGSKTATTTVVVTTPVTGLSMSAMPVVLNPTKLYTLHATVLPTTATNRALIWESTNTAVATVDSNGVVKAITSGSCGISATTLDGDYSAIAEVNVVTPLVGVQLMVNTPLPIHINDVVQILVVMVPTTASNQQFTWTVTDGVDGNIFTTGPPQNGNIVYLDAVQAGNSVFTVTTADGNKQASINLTVVPW